MPVKTARELRLILSSTVVFTSLNHYSAQTSPFSGPMRAIPQSFLSNFGFFPSVPYQDHCIFHCHFAAGVPLHFVLHFLLFIFDSTAFCFCSGSLFSDYRLSLSIAFLFFCFFMERLRNPILDRGYCCLEAGSGLCSCSTGGNNSFSWWNWVPFFKETEFHNKGGLSQFGICVVKEKIGLEEEREDESCYCRSHFHGGFELLLLRRFCSCVEGIMEVFSTGFSVGALVLGGRGMEEIHGMWKAYALVLRRRDG